MIFQKHIESTDIEKIEEYLLFLGFECPSLKDSLTKVFQKENIIITMRVRE